MTLLNTSSQQETSESSRSDRPRLGFIGLGWIGQHRLQAVAQAGTAEIAAMADLNESARQSAGEIAPKAQLLTSLDELLKCSLDGIVIATPSAMHAGQVQQALRKGIAVFCQKPLGRTEQECREIVETARTYDCLLGVDFSYRCVQGLQAARQRIQSGELGEIYLMDLTFHNAYGPDKSWFYDYQQSGGGCVIDLGSHLIDLAFWLRDDCRFENVQSTLWRQGKPHEAGCQEIEDTAIAEWQFAQGGKARLACSWNLQAGVEAVIELRLYGTQGAIVVRNLNGSFYDFVVEECHGTQTQALADIDNAWGGRAIVNWTQKLAVKNAFDDEIEQVVKVAHLIDKVYGR